MARKIVISFFIFLEIMTHSLSSLATPSVSIIAPRRQIATIIFSGLGGAVLGMSTLSFYGRPESHVSNIATGFALGIIGGTVAMSYQAASYAEQSIPNWRYEPEFIAEEKKKKLAMNSKNSSQNFQWLLLNETF
jgi:hypothetical protein